MYPSYEQAQDIAASGEYDVVPICGELYADQTTPIRVLRILKGLSHHCYLLESVDDSSRWGRYTYLGFDPTIELTGRGPSVHYTANGTTVDLPGGDPRAAIRDILAGNRSPHVEGMPAFTGGLVGYFSYDYLKYAEPSMALDAEDAEGFNDVDLMLFDKVIAFDNLRQKIIFIANVRTADLETDYRRATRDIEEMMRIVIEGTPITPQPCSVQGRLTPYFDQARYVEMVDAAKHYIREGDIFQVVLSNRLEAPFSGSLLNAYRVLRTTNPSPYMFYFSSDDIEIAGSSPETLVKLEDGVLHTFPLAGTRPRGATPEQDRQMERELVADEKELAEHNMLVDLGRNDLGRVSEFGSVTVDRFRDVLRYSHVMHLGSEVSGTLRSDKTALDAIDAVLPAGTLSGAPKLRAAEIINELEGNKRGIYGGAVGYLAFTGNMDVCIAIRLAYAKQGKVFVRSGAGIVADSVPENEYRECMNKAQAVIEAIETARKDDTL